MPQTTSDGRPVYIDDKFQGSFGLYSFVRPSVMPAEDLEDVLAWWELMKRQIVKSVAVKETVNVQQQPALT